MSIIKNSIVIFLFALIIRIGYVVFFVETEYLFTEDQGFYAQLAKNLPNNNIFGLMPERMPGYPLFIAAIYTFISEGVWGVVLIQILLDSISCIVIALTARLLFKKGFWVAGVLSVINLNMIILSASLLTDTLFLFLFVLFIYSLFKYFQFENKKWLFLLVLFVSLSALVRASTYYLLPVLLIGLVGWRMWKRDSVFKISKLIALYLIVVGAVLGGVHQHNYQNYRSTALVSQTGTHLLYWVAPAVYQYSGQGNYQEGQELAKENLTLALQRDHLEALSLNPFESSAYKANVAKNTLIDFGFINIFKAWIVGSTINLLAPSVAYAPAIRAMPHPSFYETKGSGILEKLINYVKNTNGFLYLLILVIGTMASVTFIMLALAGVFKMISTLPATTLITLLLLICYFLAITGPIVGVKYRLPIEPILTLFATYFFIRVNIQKRYLSSILKK